MSTYSGIRSQPVTARRVTVLSLEEVARWCNGSVRGTKLPARSRIVQWYSNEYRQEFEANVGDWIVRLHSGVFIMVPDGVFQENFDVQ